MVGLKGTSGGLPGQHHWSDQLPRTITRWLFSISMYGDSTTSLGNLCQCSVALRSKKVFPDVEGNLLCFSLGPLTLVLPHGTTETILAPSSFHSPFCFLCTHCKIPLSFFFSNLNTHSFLCLSLLERYYSPHIIFLALCWTLSSMAMSLLSWEALNFSIGRSGAVGH